MKKVNQLNTTVLRQKTEELLKKEPLKTRSQLSEFEAIKLMHELEVYKVEMELQNEELQLAEVILETQHASFKSFINSTLDIIIFSLDKNYCYTTFNEKHREEMKRTWNADIEIGMNLLDCMHIPELKVLAKKNIDLALHGEIVTEIQHQTDLDIYYDFNWNPIWQNKKVIGVTAFIKDITLIMQAELNLKEKNNYIEAQNEEYFQINKELAFQNEEKEKRATELIIANKELAFQNEEKEKRATELIIANKELAFQNEEKEKRAAELIVANKELVFQNEEKEKRATELVIANKELVFQKEEKEKRAAELVIANKELAFQNEEKEKRAAELVMANKELEQFAYVASHDLQEPLRMISSFTQLLERKYKDKLDQDANDYIRFAVDGAIRMQKLINDLLDFSRVSTRGKELVQVDSSRLLGQVVSTLQQQIMENNALITNDDLPAVKADESQLLQLFQNLIANAIKFKSRTELPKIHISCIMKNNLYEFSVRDNGIGIDMQYHDRIFTIFQRLHSAQDYPGTGIGLSISKSIVERHGGKIWFESIENEGTIFYFTIPV